MSDPDSGASHRLLPDKAAVKEAGEVVVTDAENNQLPLKSLWTERPEKERQLLIFIRHFFCGSCKQYVQALMQDLPPSTLEKANATITIIGCGQTVCIPDYAKATSCSYPIYADPRVRSYASLGMMRSLKVPEVSPTYIKTGFWANAIGSGWTLLKDTNRLKGGPSWQNGGEWLFEDGEVKWCHRMRNTMDHAEVEELRELLGIKK